MLRSEVQGGVAMNWLIHLVPDSWSSYIAINSSSYDPAEDSEARDMRPSSESPSNETFSTVIKGSVVLPATMLLSDVVHCAVSGGSEGGSGASG